MRAFTISVLIYGSLVGCVSFGPADGQFYATGSTPGGGSCILSLAAVGSSGAATERIVSGAFRESFIVSPSRQGHRAALTCDGSVMAARTFKYGQDVRIGGELAIGGGAP